MGWELAGGAEFELKCVTVAVEILLSLGTIIVGAVDGTVPKSSLPVDIPSLFLHTTILLVVLEIFVGFLRFCLVICIFLAGVSITCSCRMGSTCCGELEGTPVDCCISCPCGFCQIPLHILTLSFQSILAKYGCFFITEREILSLTSTTKIFRTKFIASGLIGEVVLLRRLLGPQG